MSLGIKKQYIELINLGRIDNKILQLIIDEKQHLDIYVGIIYIFILLIKMMDDNKIIIQLIDNNGRMKEKKYHIYIVNNSNDAVTYDDINIKIVLDNISSCFDFIKNELCIDNTINTIDFDITGLINNPLINYKGLIINNDIDKYIIDNVIKPCLIPYDELDVGRIVYY